MEIYGDLDFKEVGQLVSAAIRPENTDRFPDAVAGFALGSIKQGRFAFFNKRVWIAVEVTSGVASWIPITNEINAYVHSQAVASTEWTIEHDLETGTPVVNVYDSDNRQVIPDDIEPTSQNEVKVYFTSASTGRAIVLSGDFAGVDRKTSSQVYSFVMEQETASTTWVVSHGLGYYPIVRVFLTSNNEEILPQSIVHDSVMQVTITFSSATAGIVRLI